MPSSALALTLGMMVGGAGKPSPAPKALPDWLVVARWPQSGLVLVRVLTQEGADTLADAAELNRTGLYVLGTETSEKIESIWTIWFSSAQGATVWMESQPPMVALEGDGVAVKEYLGSAELKWILYDLFDLPREQTRAAADAEFRHLSIPFVVPDGTFARWRDLPENQHLLSRPSKSRFHVLSRFIFKGGGSKVHSAHMRIRGDARRAHIRAEVPLDQEQNLDVVLDDGVFVVTEPVHGTTGHGPTLPDALIDLGLFVEESEWGDWALDHDAPGVYEGPDLTAYYEMLEKVPLLWKNDDFVEWAMGLEWL